MSDYRYDAIIRVVHDGDSVTVDADLGFGVWWRGLHVRLLGINAPELNTPEGKAARDFLAGLLPAGSPCLLESYRDRADKYGGRWLGTIRLVEGGESVNGVMVKSGHAKPWDGQGPKPV